MADQELEMMAVRALAFILGKYLVYVLWGVVSLNLA
jgi:hypothetical protein